MMVSVALSKVLLEHSLALVRILCYHIICVIISSLAALMLYQKG